MLNTGSRKLLLGAGVSALALCATALTNPVLAQTAAPTASDNTLVVVTARRKALLTADERKKNADSIIDSVVADEAGKLPDNSITEVLQRVSGVSIVRFASLGDPDHFSAEGSGIQVRGLSGVAGHLNGREIFSANGGRGISWGDVTPELMSAVDIYKSSTADLIEGGTGGAIDLHTKMPFDYKKPAFQANIGESYGDLSKDWTPSGSFLITKRWDTPVGEFGALIDLAYSKYAQNTNFIRMEPYYKTQVKGVGDRYIPGGIDYGYDHYDRDRTGIYAAFQWKPSDTLLLSTILFSTKYVQDGYGQGVFATSNHLTADPKANDAVYDENGGFVSGTLSTFRTSDGAVYDASGNAVGGTLGAGGDTGANHSENVTTDWSTTFKWTPFSSFKLEGAVQVVDSEHKSKAYDVFPSMAFPGSFNLNLTGDYPVVTFPSSTQFSDLSNYHWNATQDHTESNHGFLGAANLDAEWQLSDTGLFRSIKAGVRYASRTENDGVGGYNWTALGQGWNGSPNVYFNSGVTRPGDIAQVPFENFFRGDTSPPAGVYLPSIAMAQNYDPVGDHAVYGGNPQNPMGIKSYERSSASTHTTSAYVMTRFAGDNGLFNVPFSGNLGVRVVQVENFASGYYTQPTQKFIRDGLYYDVEAISNGQLNTGGRTSVRVLPNLNVQFSPSSTVKLRFAYNITMDNPSFSALKANGGLGVTTIANPLSHAAIPASGSTPAQVAANYPVLWTGFTTSSGNPTLKPTMSGNFDVSAEWYASKSFSAHFALFYKSISDPLVYQNTTVDVPVTYTAATTTAGAGGVPAYTTAFAGTRTETALKTDYTNSSQKATVKGFELGARKFFDNLPSPWDGLGVEANYTYIDSANPGDLSYAIDNVVSTATTVTGTLNPVRDANNQVVNSHPLTDNPLAGLSKHNANLTLMYEHSAWSLRLAYSWRSPYLMNTGVHGTNPAYTYYDYTNNKAYGIQTGLPLWSDEYGALDFGGSYKINEHIRVSINASNLTNSVVKTQMYGGYPGNANFTRSWFVTDQRVNVGLTLAY